LLIYDRYHNDHFCHWRIYRFWLGHGSHFSTFILDKKMMTFDEKGEPVKLGYYWKSQTYKFKHMAELLESQNKLLKAEIKMHDDSLDAAVKTNKQDNKVVIKTRKKSPNFFLLGLITGIIITLIARYAINQTLKKYS
jgi:hypothetical protein